jgi:uncharacterized protein YvpB
VSRNSTRRRSAPLLAWLALGGLAVTVLAIGLLGFWSWQQADQIQKLQREITTLDGDHKMAQEQIAVLQATASILQHQVASSGQPKDNSLEPIPETAVPATLLSELRSTVERLAGRVEHVETTLEEVLVPIQDQEEGANSASEPLPLEARLPLPPQKQSHSLSCESSAAAMAAQFYGVPLTESQVLAALPRTKNPNLGFRGDVDGSPGGVQDYGVYAGPILEILKAQGLEARLVEGGRQGIQAAIARGHPVVAWITYNCQVSTPVTRTVDGQVVSLVPYQHAVVVTGYNADGVWANDPWDGLVDYYAMADFSRALAYFGDMAIEVAAPGAMFGADTRE